MNAPVQLYSLRERTGVVDVYGFPMHCTYEYDEGESPTIGTDGMFDHPGAPASVCLLTCAINGQDVMDMLSLSQQERIEDEILQQLER